ncbi:OmpH family outer membrane protein [Sphingomonas sp. MS122]|uniref:OmpH family outer membrane protein n=1 Tax=Sphingomonas sp. MS122 TaxID=3412683 RepID=UPI003C2ABEAF
MRYIGPLVAFLLTYCVSAPAAAQTFGPSIQGLCLLSRSGAISGSRAGQSLQVQLRQMQASLSGDLARQRATIDQQRRTLAGRQNAIAPIEYQRQRAALDQQAQALEQQHNARFIAAQQRGQQQIDRVLNEALARVITRTACGVVLERDHAYGWNNAMDITPSVSREMDGLLASVSLQ